MARRKLAIWPLVLAGLIAVGGVVAFALVIAASMTEMGARMTRFVAPGDKAITLEPGTYVVFHEHASDLDGRTWKTPPSTKLVVDAFDAAGAAVAVEPATSRVTYSLGAREGIAIGKLTCGAAGTYTFKARRADGAAAPQTVVAVGRGVEETLVRTAFLSFTTLFGALATALALVAATLIRWAFQKS